MSEFKRVGSTDICMKCLIAHGDGRNCKCAPEEKAFFLELPDPPVPYRNFVITGITQPKCNTCGADLPTRFEGGVMHIDAHDCKPRGGFEFL